VGTGKIFARLATKKSLEFEVIKIGLKSMAQPKAGQILVK